MVEARIRCGRVAAVRSGERTVALLCALLAALLMGALLTSCAADGGEQGTGDSAPATEAEPGGRTGSAEAEGAHEIGADAASGVSSAAPAAAGQGAAAGKDALLREGKEHITVLVLNGSGVDGAAGKAAASIEELGFAHVTTGNAASHHQMNRVSYHHEEHRAEVEEVAALFEPLMSFDPYCYEDASSGGWGMDYDILVMLGAPEA